MITYVVPFTAFFLPSMWIFQIGIRKERTVLSYIRNKWMTTLSRSNGRVRNQTIRLRGNVAMTKQIPMSQTIIDLNKSIRFLSSSVQNNKLKEIIDILFS
jgi:hypothetical protein